MELEIQINSFIYSFFFGLVFYYLLDLFNIYVVKVKLFLKIILSFIFIFSSSLGYFMGLLLINDGILHIYFFGCLIGGYMISGIILNKYFTLRKRK